MKAGSACAGTDACCDPATCALRPAGTVCRAALGECDLAEVCSGSSAICPPDVGKPWGSACTSNSVPSTCYANVCLPSLDEQCNEKTAGEKPFANRDVATGSRGEASGHLCTALMCCTSCVQETGNYEINGVAVTDPVLCSGCLRSTSKSTFTVNGVSKSIYLGAAVDGSRLMDSICIQAEATSPVTAASCSSEAYFEASIGRCLLCSSACLSCAGPTNLDCTSCAGGASKDSRGACPVAMEVRRGVATITTTPGAGPQLTSTTSGRTGTIDGAASSAVMAGILLPLILGVSS
ncbi:ADAM33 [Symbiodinium pilosum]|uniref:ADAM33 protein n=1 Tax=Symbiodinium pilosum TaxID=2952 RepID=A0A812XL79_SYMPI|nr:ADAM33 [Symbiodinium pilosum]